MIGVDIKTKALMKQLEDLWPRAIKYAVASAMTAVSAAAARTFREFMEKTLDRPNRRTLNAPRYKAATKDRHEYDVYLDDTPNKGTAPSKYLRALVDGGYRANKRSETLLRAKGILPPGWQIEPGEDMPEDNYGNLRGGGARYVQILSALKVFQERGHQMNRTARSQTKRAGALKEFFVLYNVKERTPIGVYTRKGKRSVVQILKFVPKRAKYDRMLPFKRIVEKVFRGSFEKYFRTYLARMISKAKG